MSHSDFSVLENYRAKHILENRMQNRKLNSCLDFITPKQRLNSPESKPVDYYVWENIRG